MTDAELAEAKDEIAEAFDDVEDDLEEHRERVRELIEGERDVLDEIASQEDDKGEDLYILGDSSHDCSRGFLA